MKSLGYCCGRRYVFEPEDVRCVGPNSCVIQTNAKYYDYRDK